ncbi:MAG TPA: MerR family transcriptional regulator [Actinomycetota bacterium]|jgi:DNA-binding transcriptional MerR regulator
MPLSRSRDYLSIGEVLETIRADFPDISISKIRFLESEGLIRPERTGSGYRKFYDADVDRLRYILQLQRDQFLPLKVIRDRLAAADSNGGAYPQVAPGQRSEDGAGDPPTAAPAEVAPEPDLTFLSLSRDELKDAAGISEQELRQLEEFGLLVAGKETYDGDDLVTARSAHGFFAFGVEARHLRMFRQTADREATFFEQIVTPLSRRRTPDASEQASQSIHELMALSRRMREAMLRSSLRDLL